MISVCVFRLFTFWCFVFEYPDIPMTVCVRMVSFIYISVSGGSAVVAACYLFGGTFVFNISLLVFEFNSLSVF